VGAAGSAVRSALAAPRALVIAAALDRAQGRSNLWAAKIKEETARRRSAQREPIVRDATAATLVATAATLAVRRKKKQRVAQRRAGELASGPDQLEGRRPLRYAGSEMARPGRDEADLEKKSKIDRIRARGERERASAKRLSREI
jgi:hypothetical protein